MSTFSTERFKELVSYALKGVGADKSFELSTYIGIRVLDGVLLLYSFDTENYVIISDKCVSDNFDVTVNADLFTKLISKINSDTIDLEVVDNTLVIKGNGKYTLELIPNEQGEKFKFPDVRPDELDDIGKISALDLVVVNNAIKASLSSVAGSVYSNYYFGDVIASTDKAMMGTFDRKIFDTPYLFNRAFVDLISMTGKDVTISKGEGKIVATTELSENCYIDVVTTPSADVDKFEIANIRKFMSQEIKSFCRFKKAQMLDLLDRLSLFVSKFDDGAIELHFTQDYIEVSSLASNGIERVDVTEFKDAQDMTIKINIDRFKNQLKAYSSDVVDLYYGSEICIKLSDGDITQVIALIK